MRLHLLSRRRTNKHTNFNANPTDLTNATKSGDAAAVLSVVDDAAELAAAGLAGICSSGKVYKLDNSLGVAVAYMLPAGVNGSSMSPHTASAYIRGGTGAIRSSATTDGITTFEASAGYIRRAGVITPQTNTRQSWFRADAGQTIYIILNQYEEGGISNPIVVAGAAVSVTM